MKIIVIGDFHGKFPDKLKSKIIKENPDLIIGVGDYTGIKDWREYMVDLFKRLSKGEERISAEEFFGEKRYKTLLKKDIDSGKKVLSELNKFNRPVFIIFGNSDDDWYSHPEFDMKAKKETKIFFRKMKNLCDITYSKKKFRGIDFIGFGGYMDIEPYFKKSTHKENIKLIRKRIARNNKMKKRFFKLAESSEKNRIFIFHYPPYGVFDIIKDKRTPMHGKSSGVKFFREGIKKFRPFFALCGHMHEYQGMKKISNIPIINPGAAVDGKMAVIEIDDKKVLMTTFYKKKNL